MVHQKVKESDNNLRVGYAFRLEGFQPYEDPGLDAAEKELYLVSLYETNDSAQPWQLWMVHAQEW